MIKKFNMIFILLLLLFVCIGSVSAADDLNETISIDEISDIDGGEILSASEYTVNPSNYNQYFSSTDGKLIDSVVKAGDTITLSGSFSSNDFVITKNITLKGSGATINDGTITLNSDASGCLIKDLTIKNNVNTTPGVFLDGASYCTVDNLDISCCGVSSFPICLNEGSNYNTITNNRIETLGATYGHGTRSTSGIVLGASNNNYIANNVLNIADANGIYLSNYGSGSFKGGVSFNNVIYNNSITYTVNATSWAYAIQMMGGNNTADSNVINGAYRGVSSSNYPLNKAINNIINIKGYDYSTGALSGGDYAIALSSNATVRNNTVNGMFTGAAISAGDNSVIEQNYVNATKGYGIVASGDEIKVMDNEIYTVSSAGIDQQGKYTGIVVNRNTIVSESGIGVLISKASKTKYPSNITITNNIISTSNQYIINAADADKNSYVINNNTGTGKILTPSGEEDPSTPDFIFNGTTLIITPANYHNFIDDDGNLKSDFVDEGDILYFNGTFENKQIILTKSVKVTGLDPVFKNSTFVVTTDSVWIENITVINQGAERCNAWAIFVADTKTVKIVNNVLTVYDPAAAYAVYIYQSSKVYVEDNILTSHGDSLTYTLLGYGAEECEFKNNTVICIGTGEIHAFENSKSINGNTSAVCIGQCLGDILKEHCLDGTNIVPELYRTYGILMIGSSNNTLIGNDVSVTSLINESFAVNSTNSLVGVDFYYGCDNNIISNNNINVTGLDNYLYGAGAIAHPTGQSASSTAKNNVFSNNTIYVSGSNVVEGLIFGDDCTDNKITDNNIILDVNRTAYGITLEMSGASTITGNNITFNSDIGYGIEAYQSSDNTIKNNIITGTGKVISGIAAVNSKNNEITDNTITSNGDGSDLGFIMHDVIQAPNSGIFFDGNSTGNFIDSNSIVTQNGYPVDLSADTSSNTVTNNYLKGKEGSGDEGVNSSKSNTVHDNYASSFDNATMDDIVVLYNGEFTIVVDAGNGTDGAVAVFRLDNLILGNTTVKDGKAVLAYDLDKNYNVGNYTITASLTKTGFKNSEITSNLEIIKSNITTTVDEITTKAGATVPFIATLIDINNKTVAGAEVKFYRNANYVGSAVSDENGVATTNIKIPAGLKGNFTIFATVADSDNYMQSSGQAMLIISENAKLYTVIEADDLEMNCKDGTRYVATIKDLDGNVISGLTISRTVNGVTRDAVTNESGQISFGLNGLNPGNYSVELVFNGDSKYEASSANATVTVKQTLFGNDIVMMFKNGTRYYAAILENNKPVANEEVSLNINGVFYYRTTNAVGTVSLAINLAPGTYVITAQRTSTGEQISNNITVNSLLTENNDIDMYFRNGSGYTVKVIKQDGSVAGAGEEVTFNINGVFYTRQTDENGIAKLNINLAPGDYIITAEYEGCKVSNNIAVKPVLSASDLTKKFGESTPFAAKLVDGQGKPYAGQNVTFNINGVFYTRTTDDEGVARLNINLMAGEYIITSTFNNGNIANKVTITA